MGQRFKKFSNYRFDRWIFQGFMFLIFAFLLLLVWLQNFNLDYYYCGAEVGEMCENPFYKPAGWKNEEFLPGGEYGQPPSFFLTYALEISLALLGTSFIVNHLVHNRHISLKIGGYEDD